MTSYRDVLDALEREEYVSAEQADRLRDDVRERRRDPDRSRVIAAVAGIGAWMSALFLLMLLFVVDLVSFGDPWMLAYVVIFGGVALVLDDSEALNGVFTDQFTMAASITAQLTVPFAMAEHLTGPGAVLQVLVSGTMYALIDTRAHRILSAGVAIGVLVVISATESSLAGYMAIFGVCFCAGAVGFGLRHDLPSKVATILRPGRLCGGGVCARALHRSGSARYGG